MLYDEKILCNLLFLVLDYLEYILQAQIKKRMVSYKRFSTKNIKNFLLVITDENIDLILFG